MEAWITAGVAQGERGTLERIMRTNDRGHEVLAAEGYEFERTCCVPEGEKGWTERVLVVRSPRHAAHKAEQGLAIRLSQAEKTLAALTPPRGRGKRQMTDEVALVEAIDKVLKAHRVSGLLSVAWEKQVADHAIRGPGTRFCASREVRDAENPLPHHPHHPYGGAITALTQRFGWKAFVTNAPRTRLSYQEAVLCYRNEYRVKHIFNRLKSRVHIAPLFVKLNEEIAGLTYLLTLGVRVLTVMEFVLRRSLVQDQAGTPICTQRTSKRAPTGQPQSGSCKRLRVFR